MAISNSRAIGAFDKGPLRAWKTLKKKLGKNAVQTARQYVGKDGRKKFQGTKALQSTQPLPKHYGVSYHAVVEHFNINL